MSQPSKEAMELAQSLVKDKDVRVTTIRTIAVRIDAAYAPLLAKARELAECLVKPTSSVNELMELNIKLRSQARELLSLLEEK